MKHLQAPVSGASSGTKKARQNGLNTQLDEKIPVGCSHPALPGSQQLPEKQPVEPGHRSLACVLKLQRKKTSNVARVTQTHMNKPNGFENYILINSTKACVLGRKPPKYRVKDDFKACFPGGPEWQHVSATHCILKFKDEKLTIEDRSSNGTWIGKPGRGAGDSEDDFRRLTKGQAEKVAMNSYIMLAGWPDWKNADDVIMCDVCCSPPETLCTTCACCDHRLLQVPGGGCPPRVRYGDAE